MVAVRRILVALSVLLILMTWAPAWAGPGTFQVVGPMVQARQGAVATLLKDGSVLVTGGYGSDTIPLATGQFQVTGRMAVARDSLYSATPLLAVSLPNGRVAMLGGGASAVELYDPAKGVFVAAGTQYPDRPGATSVPLANGKVLRVG